MAYRDAARAKSMEPVTVRGTITATRGKSHTFIPDAQPERTVYLPISEIAVNVTATVPQGECADITMPRWLAEDRGLEGDDDLTGDLFT